MKTTQQNQNPSSQVTSGLIDQTSSECERYLAMLKKCLDLLDRLIYEAVGANETEFNPSEYLIPSEILDSAAELLEKCEDL